jgi:ribose transport system permease protein
MTVEATSAELQKPRAGINLLLSLTLLGLLILLWAALALSTNTFLTTNNITNLLRQSSLWAIIAIGQTFVIITAGIDLSVGAVIGISSVIVAWLLTHDVSIPAAIGVTLLTGVCIGLFHAFGIVKLGLPPFIMTLATMTALRGIGLLITGGATISGLPDAFTSFSLASLAGIPLLFWCVIAVAVPSYIFLNHTRFGRYLFAIGSNREAARLSGVNVTGMLYLAYVLSATFAAFAGVLTAIRISSGNATNGDGWELQSIASSVIGGTSLFGAVGSIQGPLLGAVLLTTINNGANLLYIDSYWQKVITGALIILIVYFDQLRRRRG